MTNVTVDDTYSSSSSGLSVTWQGAWDRLDEKSQSSLGEQATLGSDFNKTLAVTSKIGASVTFSAPGEWQDG